MIEIPPQAMLEQIAALATEPDAEKPYTATDAAAILEAYRNLMGGDPLGTVRRDPDTGALGIRVNVDGLYMWRVSHPDGTQWNDLQPTLVGWTEVAVG